MPKEPGELSHRVEIYKPTRGTDAVGGAVAGFAAALGRWAEVDLSGGGETVVAGQQTHGASGTVTVRWENDFQEAGTDWRIGYRGRLFEVTRTENVRQENELIVFGVSEVPPEQH